MQWIVQLPPIVLKGAGVALVALVLLGGSYAFGLFESNYDIRGPYDQLYPSNSPTPTIPGSTKTN
jgi:hypothetical protein